MNLLQRLLNLPLILITLYLTNPIYSKLSILSGRQAIEEMGSTSKEDPKDMSYTLATFGSVPYGMTIMGFAHYDAENEFGCNHGTFSPYNYQDIMPFVVVRRGKCQFLTKVNFINFTQILIELGHQC